MTPSDHNQAEYVRGIAAGKRIERQYNTFLNVRHITLAFMFGVVLGGVAF